MVGVGHRKTLMPGKFYQEWVLHHGLEVPS